MNSKKKDSALVVFNSIAAAKICMQKEKGLEACPLSFRMLHETDTSDIKQPSPRTDSTNSQSYVSSEPGKFVSFPSSNVSHNIAS